MTAIGIPSAPLRRLAAWLLTATFVLGVVTAGLISAELAGLRSPRQPGGPGVPGHSPSPIPTASPTPSPTPSPSPSPTATPTLSPTASPTPTSIPTVRPTPRQTAASTPPSSALPACRYDDILTPRHAYSQWATTLLDTIYRLPSTYYPGDLADVIKAGFDGGYRVRGLVIADLEALGDHARSAGVPLAIVSGFRSFEQQQATFDYWVRVGGYQSALRTSARPGHSEHQLGTAVDFTSHGGAKPWEYADWATTPAGRWLALNGWRHGFVMSYPKGRSATTCYDYEPWHYRHVGRAMAEQVTHSGLTLREYLWEIGH